MELSCRPAIHTSPIASGNASGSTASTNRASSASYAASCAASSPGASAVSCAATFSIAQSEINGSRFLSRGSSAVTPAPASRSTTRLPRWRRDGNQFSRVTVTSAAAAEGGSGGGEVENAGVSSSSSSNSGSTEAGGLGSGGSTRSDTSSGREAGSAASEAQQREEQQQIEEILAVLEQQLKDATAEENYREAARLRDAIREVEARDPVRRLKQQLEAAIAGERYEEAASLSAELARIAPPPPPPPALPASSCTSDTLTEGVRVVVRSVFVRHRSDPARSHFFFAYRVRITNEGPRVVRLVNRHWLITNGKGRVEHVRGPGVVGQQPVLPPGATFEYTSMCPLDTRKGAMEGEFEMIDTSTSTTFLAKIGAFALDADEDGL
ncbi:hypothetical protein CLOP_g14393 [Closterium sp. NIES-67]|nr:hypothetical protein CLOP_g14393 [Closterium sp. NIES-67]